MLRRQEEEARLVGRRAALKQRHDALLKEVAAERARHGSAISEPTGLTTARSGVALETERADLDRLDTKLDVAERRLRSEAAAARRATLVRGLDAVVQAADVEIGPDRSLERLRARQASAGVPGGSGNAAATRAEVDLQLGRLTDEVPDEAMAAIQSLAAEVLAAEPARAALALDALRFKVQQANRRAVAVAETVAEVARWRERLALLADGLPTDVSRLLAEAQLAGLGIAPALEQRMDDMLAEAQARTARTYAATALESALTELGYDVGEQFDTILVQEGYVDVRRAEWAGYAVRVRMNAGRPAVGFNVVRSAAHAAHDTRDHAVESAWCDSLGDLRSHLNRAGVRTELTRAVEAGKVPLQVVDDLPATGAGSNRRRRAKPASREISR